MLSGDSQAGHSPLRRWWEVGLTGDIGGECSNISSALAYSQVNLGNRPLNKNYHGEGKMVNGKQAILEKSWLVLS